MPRLPQIHSRLSQLPFFRSGRPADCREPIAEPVADKQRANFCDYFEPGSDTFHPGENAEKLRSAADDLFNI